MVSQNRRMVVSLTGASIRAEQKQRIENEATNFKKLYTKAKRWQRARFMRDYIKAVKDSALERNELSEELQNWIIWANDKADWYDPLVNKADALLNHLNINKILDS